MPFPSTLFTQGQLEIAAGGAANLLQLVDKDNTQDLASPSCQAFIDEVQQAALSEVCSILQVAFDPSDATFQGSAFVKQHGVVCGLYWAWHKSTGGVAVPEEVRAAHDNTVSSLKDAREGLLSLATEADPTSNVGVKTVDVDSTGTRILRQNMGGFC